MLALVFMTVLSHRAFPVKTNENRLTPQVAAGKDLFERKNCINCHTILGEGAYFAPDLTRVMSRRGPEWLTLFLKNPDAVWYGSPENAIGKRRMPNPKLTDAQVGDLVAFFEWVSRVDTNGWMEEGKGRANPPTPTPPKTPENLAVEGEKLARSRGCAGCHKIKGQGGTTGPSLDGIKSRRDDEFLRKWLKNPQAVKPGTTMPNPRLNDEQIRALLEFLKTL